jgi:hypothetical protein
MVFSTSIMMGHGAAALFALVLVLGGIQCVLFGLLGELLSRAHFEWRDKPIYAVREFKSRHKETGDWEESARPFGGDS